MPLTHKSLGWLVVVRNSVNLLPHVMGRSQQAVDVSIWRDAIRNGCLLVPGRADGEGPGGARQWLVNTFEKRRCLGPDRPCFVIKRHYGAWVEVVLDGLVGERWPDFVVDAVNLCEDDGRPQPDGVCRRGHRSQALMGDERDGVVECLSLPNSM